MSEKSAVTTRSKLRRLKEDVQRKRALEADSGVPSDRPPGSTSTAPTLHPEQTQVIPLTGPGRVIDYRDTSTSVRSMTVKRIRSGITSLRNSQKSTEYLRRRAEYEAEKELVQMREKIVQKNLEADLAAIDAAAEEDLCYEAEETTACRIEEWVTHTTPVVSRQEQVSTCQYMPPPRTQPQIPVSEILSEVFQRAPVTAPPPPVQPEPSNRNAPKWDTGAEEVDKDRCTCDGKIDQLAEAIANLARPRPLPRQAYELPTFKGNPAKWLFYKNMYHDTTTMYEFKPHENLARLKTSLQGEARIVVEDLLRESASPSEIIKTLDEEYGHPNLILECVLKKVRKLPKVTESGRELRRFSATVRNCVSLLKSVCANGYLNNPQLMSELLNKLTPVHRAQYGDFAMGMAASQGLDMRVSPSLETLSEFLSNLHVPHENLARMKTSLQGEARIAMEDLLRASASPSEIIKTLDEEYGHTNLILECALKKVRELPKVTESGRELRRFSATVRNCVSLLKSVCANAYLNNQT